MKHLPFALLALAATAAYAQNEPAAKHTGGQVEFVSIDKMPIPVPPSELQKAKRVSAAKAADGFSTIETSPQTVRQFLANVDLVTSLADERATALKMGSRPLKAPQVVRNVSELKLGFKTAAMHRGELIGASPQGTIVGDAWTGVERFYRIAGAGIVRISETDLKATGGRFYMLKDAINTQVGGQPAISKVFNDGEGRTVEEVLWVQGHKLFMLTFAPDMENGRFGLAKSNVRISANSLAQELR